MFELIQDLLYGVIGGGIAWIFVGLIYRVEELEKQLEDQEPDDILCSMWLYSVYDKVDEGNNRRALFILYSYIEYLISHSKLDDLDMVLLDVELDRIPPQLMVAILRSTRRVAPVLTGWNSLLQQVKDQLEKDEIPNRDVLLFGLYPVTTFEWKG